MTTVLDVKNLTKAWPRPKMPALEVLSCVEMDIQKGESVAIVGPSGSGKSTLLSLLAGLDRPTAGSICILGQDMALMNESELAKFRGTHIGIVFQQFHLMPALTALENVMLPLDIAGMEDSEQKALALLKDVNLLERKDHLPNTLSGGESQRIAIARALATNPAILLADEPSGNLDPETGSQIADLLFSVAEKHDMTMLLVTHNMELAGRCNRSLFMRKGSLHETVK